jgi:UDP-N-acetylmuramate dehydrogenase
MPTILQNINLKDYNTFGLNAQARFFSVFDDLDSLKELLNNQELENLPRLILGGGSNILLTKDFEGLVFKNEIKGIEISKEDSDFVWLKSGAGEIWNDFVVYCVNNNWGGVENLSLIPGTVGAAPMQNIGAYGTEIKDTFECLEALHIETGNVEVFDLKACDFGYRESVFKHTAKDKYIIISVSFKLRKNPKLNLEYGAIKDTLLEMGVSNPTIKEVSDAVVAIRTSKLPDPKLIGNSGSFFKNPEISKILYEKIKVSYPGIPMYPINDQTVKVPAGWLIEQAGWKGKRFGDIGVHEKQALVLVNYGGGSGLQIKKLSEDIKISVFEKFGVNLHTEVNFI